MPQPLTDELRSLAGLFDEGFSTKAADICRRAANRIEQLEVAFEACEQSESADLVMLADWLAEHGCDDRSHVARGAAERLLEYEGREALESFSPSLVRRLEQLIPARRDVYRAAIAISKTARELAIARAYAPYAMMALGVERLAEGASIEQVADAMRAQIATEDAQPRAGDWLRDSNLQSEPPQSPTDCFGRTF